MAHSILVVDDDARLRDLLSRYLREQGFDVCVACDAQEARNFLDLLEFDLIVLDIMMPGETGLELTRDLSTKITTPILLLTAMGEAHQRIDGLEQGAEEYLSKPFEPKELVLRIQKILKRTAKPKDVKVRMGHFTFDAAQGVLYEGDVPVKLTETEAHLLTLLGQEPGVVISRETLADHHVLEINPRSVDVQITRLRKKIEPDPTVPRYLQTVRHRGYVLKPD